MHGKTAQVKSLEKLNKTSEKRSGEREMRNGRGVVARKP